MITQIELKEILKYEPESGIFRWINTKGKRLKNEDIAGYKNPTGYIKICYKQHCYMAHRLAWLYMNNEHPNQIDHIDGNKSNNSYSNLRDVDATENARNTTIRKTNTSGRIGVTFSKSSNKFISQIVVNRKCHRKSHESFEDAVKSRQEMEIKYGFHKNHGRQKSS